MSLRQKNLNVKVSAAAAIKAIRSIPAGSTFSYRVMEFITTIYRAGVYLVVVISVIKRAIGLMTDSIIIRLVTCLIYTSTL